MNRLANKIALVTGAHSGIGYAIAHAFRDEGAFVIASDLPRVVVTGEIGLDVSDEANWQAIVSAAVDEHGRLDILVNNAGTASGAALHELDLAEWKRVLSVNQLGPYLGMRAVMPHMIRAGHGSIINISSIFGARAVPGEGAYHATKAAVLGMTRNAAVTYAEHNIRVNAILPGWIATPMTQGRNEEVIDRTPMRRGGRPQEIAAAAVFLASDESSYVTGVELPVDGGYLAI